MLFFNLSAFYFFYFAAVSVYIIFMPKVLHDIGYDPFQIGIIFALVPLMRFLTPFLFLKHITLNQKVFQFALFTSIICSSLFYLTIDSFFIFMINNAVLGACLSLILPYLEVTAIKELGKNKYGKSRLFGSLGFMIISLVLAKYLSNSTIALHYYLVMNIATVLFALLLTRKYIKQNQEEKSSEKFSFLKYWPFWISLFFMQMSFGSFYNFFTIYETQHGINLELISYMWTFGVICEILMLYFQAPILKQNLLNIIKFCVIITILRWLILYLYPQNIYLTFISQGMHAFSFGLYHSSVIMYLYTLYEDKKLAQQFMYGVAYGLGGFIGAIIAGWAYGEYLFLISAFFALFSFISISYLSKIHLNKRNFL